MAYRICAAMDIGIRRKKNQDSLFMKKKLFGQEEVVLAVICDGMGGLSEGELASRKLVEVFSTWFETIFPKYYSDCLDRSNIVLDWTNLMEIENITLQEYGKEKGIQIGTTLTAMLFLQGEYIIGHVGDCRVYEISADAIRRITKDHTIIEREIELGNITEEEGIFDSRRSILLKCIGAQGDVEPDFYYGNVLEHCVYLLCSDGFRHVISNEEFQEILNPNNICDVHDARERLIQLIGMNKERKETDNITAGLILS